MATRSVTIELNNAAGIPLTKSFEHHCHGRWAPDPVNHDVIKPGETHRLVSESHGFMTGTEGYIKYQLLYTTFDSTGVPVSHNDTLYIYWDNPFLGNTQIKAVISDGTDVRPDCDFDSSFSTFGGPVSSFVLGHFGPTQAQTGITGDEFLAAVALGPFVLLGLVGIAPEAYLSLEVRPKPTTSSLGTGSGTGTLNTEPVPVTLQSVSGGNAADWRGTWIYGVEWSDVLRLDLESEDARICSVLAREDFPSSKLVIHRNHVPLETHESLLFGHEVRPKFSFERSGPQAVGFSALERAVAIPSSAPPNFGKSGGGGIHGLGHSDAPVKSSGSKTGTADAGLSPGGALKNSTVVDQMKLEDGVTLELYGEFTGANHFTKPRLRYIRRTTDGTAVVDVMLMRTIPIK